MGIKVTRWEYDSATEADLRTKMLSEGLEPYTWSNSPGDRYGAHHHQYDKVIYVVSGSIRFGLPGSGKTVLLEQGDRLDLPAGIVHDAIVGAQGVHCLEGHR